MIGWRGSHRSRLATGSRAAGAMACLAVIGLTIAGCGDIAGVRDRDLEILWPTRGAVLFDEEVLRVRLRGYSLDEYEVFWYVDDSPERRMWNEWGARTPHKAVLVDTWFWYWRGRGPYTVGFIAEDRSGRQLAHRTVRVYVE